MSTDLPPQEFLQELGVQQVIGMFELIPDILFWVKDTQSRIVHANQHYVEHQGHKSLQTIIGKDDYSFTPPYIAKQFITDDRKVMAGEIVTNRLEMNTIPKGGVAWFSTSKRPLYSDDNTIIGSYGITRHLEKSSKLLSGIEAIRGPVDFVRQHYRGEITVEQLAEVAHLSVSALERRFKKYLSKTPNQFITETRLENARRMLIDSNLSISEVAHYCGFTDHSYFSRQFKRMFDELPSQLRQTIQGD